MPPYVASKCFYHNHAHTTKAGCGADAEHETEIEKVVA